MFVWQAHERAVTALAFGPDGRFLVSAGADECAKVWEPFTGAEQLCVPLRPVFDCSPVEVRSRTRWLVCSGDGATVVVARDGSGLAFLDATAALARVARRPAEVFALKGHPDGRSVFAVERDLGPTTTTTTIVRQLPFTGTGVSNSLSPTPYHSGPAFAVSPDGQKIAAGPYVHHWPPAPNQSYMSGTSLSPRGWRYEPADYAFSADNQHLFALVGGKVMVFDLLGRYMKTKLKGHNGRITALALTPDGRRLWTASHDATVRCWDTSALTLDRIYTFQTGGLDCLAVSPDGNVAAVGSGQRGTITLWDLA